MWVKNGASQLLTTCQAGWHIFRSCLHVCLSDDNFWKPWRTKFILAHPVYLQEIRVKFIKFIGSRSRSQEQKGRKSLFPQCKTSIGNNSVSIKHRAMRFASSMGFSAMADRMVWPPSLSRDRKWPRVSKFTHSRVADHLQRQSCYAFQ